MQLPASEKKYSRAYLLERELREDRIGTRQLERARDLRMPGVDGIHHGAAGVHVTANSRHGMDMAPTN
jgi:hypothetical protein